MKFKDILKVQPYRDENDGAGGGASGGGGNEPPVQEPTLSQVLEAINGVRQENESLRNEWSTFRESAAPPAPPQVPQTPYEPSPWGEMPLTDGDWVAYNQRQEELQQKKINEAIEKAQQSLRGEVNSFTGGLVRQNAFTQLSQGLDQYEVAALESNLATATPQQIAVIAADPTMRQHIIWAAKGAAQEKRPPKVDAPTGSDMGLGNYVGDGLSRDQATHVQKIIAAYGTSREEAVQMVKDAYADAGNPLITKERAM
jgi:hypothetical protein